MRRIKIWPYKQGSRSALVLAQAAGGRVLKTDGTSRYRQRPGDLIINWGESSDVPFEGVLNSPEAVARAANKLVAFQAMSAAGVRVPTFWTNPDDIEEGHYPIVCRTVLNGHSGRGIVLADQASDLVPAPLYTAYVKKRDEYRIHVIRKPSGQCNKIEERLSCYDCGYPEAEAAGSGDYLGQCDKGYRVIATQRKARRFETENPDWRIRNHANGFNFVRDGVRPHEDVLQQAIAAVQSLGLDFGAADVIFNEHLNQAFVLEINTAPGLEGTTIEDYAQAIRSFVNV